MAISMEKLFKLGCSHLNNYENGRKFVQNRILLIVQNRNFYFDFSEIMDFEQF